MNKKMIELPYRLPQPLISFATKSSAIGELVRHNGYGPKDYPWATRMMGRFPLPSWQRGLVWTEQKNKNFIHSVFQGFDLGSVMINGWEDVPGGTLRPMSDILIDGQQRTNAIIQFTGNKFDYFGYHWDDMNRREQMRFLEAQIGLKATHCFDEKLLKRVYDLLNFTGVQHSEEQRACEQDEE